MAELSGNLWKNIKMSLIVASFFVEAIACSNFPSNNQRISSDGSLPVYISGTMDIKTGVAGLIDESQAHTYPVCFTFIRPNLTCELSSEYESLGHYTFSGNCPGFANVPFGCYIKKNDEIIASGLFDGTVSLIVGTGNLEMDVDVSVVDKAANFSNIHGSSVDNLGDFKQKYISEIPDPTGAWKLTCNLYHPLYEKSDVRDMSCGYDKEDMEVSLYLTQDQYPTMRKFNFWLERETGEACAPSEGGVNPNFHVNYQGDNVEIDYSSIDTLYASLDNVFAKLDAEVQKTIINSILLGVDFSDQYQVCDGITETSYSDANVAFVKVPLDCYDPSTNTYFSSNVQNLAVNHRCSLDSAVEDLSFSEIVNEYRFTGAITEKKVRCKVRDNTDEELPWCFWNEETSTAADNVIEQTQLYSDDGALLLLAFDSTRDYPPAVIKLPKTSNLDTEIENLTALYEDVCKRKSEGVFKGNTGYEVTEIRKNVLLLIENMNIEQSKDVFRCSQLTVPEDFTFNDCKKVSPNDLTACYGANTFIASGNFSVLESSGKLVRLKSGTEGLNLNLLYICPEIVRDENLWNEVGEDGVAEKCIDYFSELDAYHQGVITTNYSLAHSEDPGSVLLCNPSQEMTDDFNQA